MIYDNSPALGWVRITEATAQYNGKLYIIPSDSTEKKYVYWDALQPYKYTFSNTVLGESDNKRLVLINDNGMSTVVHSKTENYSITFENIPKETYTRKINALYEKVVEDGKDNVTKFSSINQRLGEVETTTGSQTELINGLETKVTNVKQTADGLLLQVNKATKIFKDQEIKEKLSNAFLEYTTATGLFSKKFQEITYDGLLPPEKTDELISYYEKKTEKYRSLCNAIESLNPLMEGNSYNEKVKPLLDKLKVEIDATNTHLNEMLQDFIRKNKVDSIERTNVNETLQKDLSITSMKQKSIEEAVAINTGGSVNENLSKILLEADNLNIRFSEFKKGAEARFSDFKQTIDGISTTVQNNVNKELSTLKQTSASLKAKVEEMDRDNSTEFTILKNSIKEKISSAGLSQIVEKTVKDTRFTFTKVGTDGREKEITESLKEAVEAISADVAGAVTTINSGGITVLNGVVATDCLTVPYGHSPYIKLFNGNSYGDSQPGIDATQNYEAGYGEHIRLKWSRNSYVRVGEPTYGNYKKSEFNVFLEDDGGSLGVFTIAKRYKSLETTSNWNELMRITAQKEHSSYLNGAYTYIAELDGEKLATIRYVDSKLGTGSIGTKMEEVYSPNHALYIKGGGQTLKMYASGGIEWWNQYGKVSTNSGDSTSGVTWSQMVTYVDGQISSR